MGNHYLHPIRLLNNLKANGFDAIVFVRPMTRITDLSPAAMQPFQESTPQAAMRL